MTKMKAQHGNCKKCQGSCLLLACHNGLCLPCAVYTPAQQKLNKKLVNAKNKNLANLRKASGH
jgi:hypothetical protein